MNKSKGQATLYAHTRSDRDPWDHPIGAPWSTSVGGIQWDKRFPETLALDPEVWAQWPDGELQRWDEMNEYEIYVLGLGPSGNYPRWRDAWHKTRLTENKVALHVRQCIDYFGNFRIVSVTDRRDYVRENWPRLSAELREIP